MKCTNIQAPMAFLAQVLLKNPDLHNINFLLNSAINFDCRTLIIKYLQKLVVNID